MRRWVCFLAWNELNSAGLQPCCLSVRLIMFFSADWIVVGIKSSLVDWFFEKKTIKLLFFCYFIAIICYFLFIVGKNLNIINTFICWQFLFCNGRGTWPASPAKCPIREMETKNESKIRINFFRLVQTTSAHMNIMPLNYLFVFFIIVITIIIMK